MRLAGNCETSALTIGITKLVNMTSTSLSASPVTCAPRGNEHAGMETSSALWWTVKMCPATSGWEVFTSKAVQNHVVDKSTHTATKARGGQTRALCAGV